MTVLFISLIPFTILYSVYTRDGTHFFICYYFDPDDFSLEWSKFDPDDFFLECSENGGATKAETGTNLDMDTFVLSGLSLTPNQSISLAVCWTFYRQIRDRRTARRLRKENEAIVSKEQLDTTSAETSFREVQNNLRELLSIAQFNVSPTRRQDIWLDVNNQATQIPPFRSVQLEGILTPLLDNRRIPQFRTAGHDELPVYAIAESMAALFHDLDQTFYVGGGYGVQWTTIGMNNFVSPEHTGQLVEYIENLLHSSAEPLDFHTLFIQLSQPVDTEVYTQLNPADTGFDVIHSLIQQGINAQNTGVFIERTSHIIQLYNNHRADAHQVTTVADFARTNFGQWLRTDEENALNFGRALRQAYRTNQLTDLGVGDLLRGRPATQQEFTTYILEPSTRPSNPNLRQNIIEILSPWCLCASLATVYLYQSPSSIGNIMRVVFRPVGQLFNISSSTVQTSQLARGSGIRTTRARNSESGLVPFPGPPINMQAFIQWNTQFNDAMLSRVLFAQRRVLVVTQNIQRGFHQAAGPISVGFLITMVCLGVQPWLCLPMILRLPAENQAKLLKFLQNLVKELTKKPPKKP